MYLDFVVPPCTSPDESQPVGSDGADSPRRNEQIEAFKQAANKQGPITSKQDGDPFLIYEIVKQHSAFPILASPLM